MPSLVESIPLLLVIGAFLAATASASVVFYAFRSKPLNIKQWLFVFVGGWVPWSGFTVLMRIAPGEELALWFLRGSFISLQVLSYANFRFHHMLVFRNSDNRFASFGMAALMGFNIMSSFNPLLLSVQLTPSGLYWVDLFHPLLLVSNLVLNAWSAIWAVGALRALNLFSTFYNPDGTRKVGQITAAIILPSSLPILLIFWILQVNTDVAPDVTLFIVLSIFITPFLAWTYGIRPISTILTPQRLWSFVVISASGIPIYERDFSKTERIGDLILFSGALNATNIMVQIELSSQSSLELVSMEDREVMIRSYENYLFCLIVDHESPQLDNVLDEIALTLSMNIDFLADMETSRRRRIDSTTAYRFLDNTLDELLLSISRGQEVTK